MSEAKEPNVPGPVWARLLAMSVAGVCLFLAAQAFLYMRCWGLLFITALVAWPIWYHRQENALFQRRAMLAAIAKGQSNVKRWFWAGSFTRFVQVFVALLWAALLLGFAVLLKPIHWWILAADILLLSLFFASLYRGIADEVNAEHLGLVVRRWPLPFLNLVALTLAFLVADFYTAVPDTRGIAWNAVAENAFTEVADQSSCVLAGWLAGALAAVEHLTWHASEVLIPSLPDKEMKLLAWGVFLVQAGVVAYGFTRMMLGVISALETRRVSVSTLTGESTFSKVFILTILSLAAPYIYLSTKLADFDTSRFEQSAKELVARANPCDPSAPAITALQMQLDSRLEKARRSANLDVDQQVDASMEKLFGDVESGVDAYLDWYFTVLGEYERLAAIAMGDFAELMTSQLEHHLFELTDFTNRLDSMDAEITQRVESTLSAAAQEVGRKVLLNAEASPCMVSVLDLSTVGDLERDGFRASAAAASGVAAGALTAKVLASKAAATVPAKIASKKGFQAAASLAGKVAAKKGGSILLSGLGAAAVCSPGGPLAAVCGVAAGLATWFVVDKAFVEIDEAVFREEMREEILNSVQDERAHLASTLKRRHQVSIDTMAGYIQSSIDRLFVPARDGL